MGAGGMAAVDVTQASEQAKTREWVVKNRFKELEDGLTRVQHRESCDEAWGREGGYRDEVRPTQKDDKESLPNATPWITFLVCMLHDFFTNDMNHTQN